MRKAPSACGEASGAGGVIEEEFGRTITEACLSLRRLRGEKTEPLQLGVSKNHLLASVIIFEAA
jgi:hypothetical protein